MNLFVSYRLLSYRVILHRFAMHRAILLLACIATAWLAAPQGARAQSQADCETITNWHAYNTCLASFGPRRGQRATGTQPRAEEAERTVYGRRGAATRSAVRVGPRGLSVQRVSGGRVRATFDVSGPRRVVRR